MTQAIDLALTSPVADLAGYVRATDRFPVLSAEEEHALAVRLRDTDDLNAAWALVTSNLRQVVWIARSYGGYGLPQGDLIQEGNVGLMKAVRRFDPDRGVRLITFAVHWIRAEIHEFIIRNWRIVKVATTKAQRKLFFNLRSLTRNKVGWLKEGESREIATGLDVPEREVTEMEMRLTARDEAFDAPVDDDEAAFAPAQYLPDLTLEPSRLVEAGEVSEHDTGLLAGALESLDERSRDIIEQRWLGERKTTLKELAAKYDVSLERVRQIEKEAMAKMRGSLEHEVALIA